MLSTTPFFLSPLFRSIVGFTVLLLIAVSSVATAQEIGEEEAQDATPALVPQRESMKIEPYTGPPIFLPDPTEAIPATEVEQKVVKEYYDTDEKTKVRIERGVVRYSDESVKNHGPYREFYENGELFVEGRYERGEPAGDWKYFYQSGSEAKTVTFENGLPTGPVEVRREDGTLKAKREFADGKRTGEWTTFGDDGTTLLREEHYVDGKADGLWQYFHEDGTKRQQSPWTNGKRNGTVIEWDKEGVKRGEVNFVDGKRDGITHLWAPDGREIEQQYDKGELVQTKIVGEEGN